MLIPIGLILAFVLVLLLRSRRSRDCRWRADRSRDRDGQSFFRCAACGEETLCRPGQTPQICLRDEKTRGV